MNHDPGVRMTDVTALEGRVTRLENAVSAGFERIEMLLQKEISELKTEQINDLREANRRLGDDQRTLWEQVRELQRREYERVGGHRTLNIIINFASAIIGGAIAWVATLITAGKPPHP